MSNKSIKEKNCMVCNDRALGFNFNAITCESCKAFFRRNALTNKQLKCPFSNQCEINPITRRFCQYCRLQKCFTIGMKKEFIMSEADKEMKRRKIEQNRNKRKLKNTDNNSQDLRKPDDQDQEEDDDETVQSSKKTVKVKMEYSPPPSVQTQADSTSTLDFDDTDIIVDISDTNHNLTSDSSVQEIVEAITNSKNPTEMIQQIMRTQSETLEVMSRIIQSPHALVLISHLIKIPSDGMMIISKLMNSSLDALEVFTKFMSSPTDALEVIFKIISSPAEVLQFMTELTKNPQSGLDIMRRFMSTPTDILSGITKIIMNSSSSSKTEENTLKNEFTSMDSPFSVNDAVSSPKTSHSECEQSDNANEQMFTEFQRDSKSLGSVEGSLSAIINQAIKLEYAEATNTCASDTEFQRLSENEKEKIQELIDSNLALQVPVDEDLSTLVLNDVQINTAEMGVDPMLIKVINLTAVAIRRLIQMSKKISGFKKMCQEDQIALLKGGCTEMMILRSLLQYDMRQEIWKVPHSTNSAGIKAEILKLCPKGNIYEEHENFIKNFDARLRTDEKIVLILCAITLFSPERPFLVHTDVVKFEQSSYFFLLRRYLESILDGCEARSAYLHLLQKLQEVKKLNEDIISVYLDVNPRQVEPLLREIFDLKV